jgi:putative effector of murein hydrolase LrgA (UPF0299 family)
MQPDTEADTLDDPPRPPAKRRIDRNAVLIGALVTGTGAVVTVAFVLSFYGLNDFGRRIMRLPISLSVLVPIGLDVFSLCGILATYLLRRATWRVRAYTWLVFFVPAGLSIAGNVAHAEHRQLGLAGVVAAALIPVILALATHLVVVVQRHAHTADADPDTRHQADSAPDDDEYEQLTPVSAPPDPAANDSDEADTAKDIAMGRALRARREGGTWAEAAEAAGVDERTVRRWLGQPPTRPTRRPTARSNGRRATAPTSTGPGIHPDTTTTRTSAGTSPPAEFRPSAGESA